MRGWHVGGVFLLLWTCAGPTIPATAAMDPTTRCLDRELRASARHAEALLACHAEAVARGEAVAGPCIQAADLQLIRTLSRAERRGSCPGAGSPDALLGLSQNLVGRAVVELVPDPAAASVCTARKLLLGGARIAASARVHGQNLRRDDPRRQARAFGRLDSRFREAWAAAEVADDCQTRDDATRGAGLFDSGLDAIYGATGLVSFENRSLPSAARPAGTPGTPGVDPNAYPNLVAQFGSSEFDLNRATYARFFAWPGEVRPDAILILVPGFEGGAMSFKILAENLVSRALENGLRLEVWAVDRRGNSIEDREGLGLAAAAREPQAALDWYFGAELGLPLHPLLAAGPKRRAFFHDAHADTAFIANWTPLVFSRDIDALVEAARATAFRENVFLGGHSAGTGFTARYASTDFDLAGGGPARPGYARLRGLVLLEGGGGSTAVPPLSEAELDRIEDRADGGLFFAVRDDAPRCSDGTPCTVASEGVDCASIGRGTCTQPTPAYALVPGLLNPRILASAEPGAVQALDDPDSGQVILQVDQGAPGNSAIDAVPDLGVLAILPQATAEGALGSFLDDDGLISAFATFVRTSVGAAGPVVDGLLTWRDLPEGPMPADAVPDNGPAPTSLPARPWGREKEVTRIDRLRETFLAPGSNFTDWYYPSSGLETTSGIGLDSTQLSVDRGRRDIENLTQAAGVDIPVICFGGTNGLTEVPASYLPFAASIGPCRAPSCDGTPRVVSPDRPNPAFPSFGGIAGGFEVYMSEGYAHVDIVTAEDDADNLVIGPLIEFLARNAR